MDVQRYAGTLNKALAKAGVEGLVRPFHDGRHTAITNDAVSGSSPAGLQKRAGHSSFSITQRYIDLAGQEFHEESERHQERVFSGVERSAPVSTNGAGLVATPGSN
jgi:integrase